MKHFRTLSLLAVSLLFAHSALSQTPKDPAKKPAKESSGVHHKEASSGPIVVEWKMKRVDGSANLTVNPDGTYLFSGTVRDKKKDRDFDISVGLKNSSGALILFHFSGNDADGVQWSKQGKSSILKDNYKSFADRIDWDGEWHTSLSKEGHAKRYEEEEAKKKRLKKAEREKEEQEEIARAQAEAQHQSSGGSSVGSDIEGAISAVGSVVNTIGSVGSAILGLF